MKKNIILFLLVLIGATNSYSQCTAPNLPTLSSLILTTTDTQLSVYFDTTANVPATTIYYLGILSTNPILNSSPLNGTTYNVGDNIGGGNIIFYGTNYIYKKTGLLAGTTYYLFIYTAKTICTGEPFYSITSLNASAITFNGTAGIPAGYYDAVGGLSCSSLKTSLYNIIKPAVANPNPTYTGLWGAYYISDDRLNDAANKRIVWDMYSDKPTGTECESTFGSPYQDRGLSGTVECQRYNREHSFPQSWFNSAEPMRSDMFIVFPTDKKVNSQRANVPYGQVSNPTYTSLNGSKVGPNTFLTQYTGTVFEPIDEYKGDFARSTFYLATAYENLVSGWQSNSNANDALDGSSYQCFDNWYLKMMHNWHLQDPVSSKEIERNNDVFMIQGNRNPYIDHPEYIALVWQCSGILPVGIIDFTAQLNDANVLLKWQVTFETNFNKYEIERSADGIGFYKIGEVLGRNLTNYSFTDNNLATADTIYYRLKMIDADGKFSYSKFIAVRITGIFLNTTVYPNPTKGKLALKLSHSLPVNSSMFIMDISGRVLMQQQILSGQRNIYLNLPQLASGRYFIKITNRIELINQSFVIIK